MDVSRQFIDSICQIFHFDQESIESCSSLQDKDSLILQVSLRDFRLPCPNCGNLSVKIKGYVDKTINHSILAERSCHILYHARRYRCPVCGKTYYETNPFVFKKKKISSELVSHMMRDLTKPTETFTSVAYRYDVSVTTVSSLFDEIVSIPRAKLPRILSIDENYAFHSKDEMSKYICVLIDQQDGRPIDILPSRRFEYLDNYYSKIPIQEKEQVRFISIDMYEPYRRIQKKHFKQASLVVDRYHVSQEMHRRLDAIRLRILRGYRCINSRYRDQEQADAYYLLKHQNHLLFKNYVHAKGKDKNRLFDCDRKRTYNTHFKTYMNAYDLAEKLKAIHPDIKKAWQLKDTFTEFYRTNTYESAPKALDKLIQTLRDSRIEEMKKFSYTLYNWRQEIIASFQISKVIYHISKKSGRARAESKRINNAMIERKNSTIKLIKKGANGYTNWERFRNRCLLVLEQIDFAIDPQTKEVIMIEKKEPDH